MVVDELRAGTWVTFAGGKATALRVRRCRLEVISGADAGLVQDFEGTVIRVGGRKSADFTLTDRAVSGFHVEIALDERGYRLRDLDSTNGTSVAGLRVSDAYIGSGATILLGETRLRFEALDASVSLSLSDREGFGGLVGGTPVMRELFARLERIAATDAALLVTGEAGTGKDLVADAVHQASARAGGPLVVLDCSALPPKLLESELFGHEKGAVTGAGSFYAGAFERAEGGTLFLDEIGDLPLDLQPKLLRAIENSEIRRVGGSSTLNTDIRIIAATNRDLGVEVSRGAFREALFCRIAVAHVQIPPLRDRPEDIPRIIDHLRTTIPRGDEIDLDQKTVALMTKYAWPGNVRELRNVIERAVLPCDGPGGMTALRGPVAAGPDRSTAGEAPGSALQVDIDVEIPFTDAKRQLVARFEREYVSALLAHHDGDISAAARAAGVDRMSIYRIAQRLGLLGAKA